MYEDLAFIDSISGNYEINKSYDRYIYEDNVSECRPNKPMKRMLSECSDYTIIGVHNHPQSFVPSENDINAAFERKYKYGIVVAHNGIVYRYSINKKISNKIALSGHLDDLEYCILNSACSINKYFENTVCKTKLWYNKCVDN